MVASQSHWSRLDESNSAENPELSEGGFMLCLRFVQHKQDGAALLHLCHQILSFGPHRCSEATDSVGIMLRFPFLFLETFAFHMSGAERSLTLRNLPSVKCHSDNLWLPAIIITVLSV